MGYTQWWGLHMGYIVVGGARGIHSGGGCGIIVVGVAHGIHSGGGCSWDTIVVGVSCTLATTHD
jgi:hypothetical protein